MLNLRSRKIKKDGVLCSVVFFVCINNEDTKFYSDFAEAKAYIDNFRKHNDIFALSFYRSETYNLLNQK